MRRVKNESDDVWDGFFVVAKNMLRPIARPQRRLGIARWNRNSRRRR
jgi:hypothetical protein